MPPERPNQIVLFDHDYPSATFYVTTGGVPMDFSGTTPELHVIDPEGSHVLKFGLVPSGAAGTLTLQEAPEDTYEELIEKIDALDFNTSYSAQIFIRSANYNQTVDTVFPFDVREAYKLRGTSNG